MANTGLPRPRRSTSTLVPSSDDHPMASGMATRWYFFHAAVMCAQKRQVRSSYMVLRGLPRSVDVGHDESRAFARGMRSGAPAIAFAPVQPKTPFAGQSALPLAGPFV
jgi:hypothetical protein